MNPNEPQNTPAPEQPQTQPQPQNTEAQAFTPQPPVVEPQSAVPATQPSTQPAAPEVSAPTEPQPTTAPVPAIPAATSAHRVNKVAYILLTFFVGAFGVHRFLRGQIGLGLVMLFFGWLTFGIWWLVDFIISLTKLSVYPGDDYEFTADGKFTM